ncbi:MULTISPECIES: hotdog fold thioesterase [Nocardioides]|nr:MULTISPECIES: hotdog fold thioesterase [unclassified Nocardioides]
MSRTLGPDLDAPAESTADERVVDARPNGHGLGAGARPSGAAIWHGRPDLDRANEMSADCAIGNLGIELTELGASHLVGRMPVDRRTRQPFGILHGGASVLLAETLVSCAATFVVAPGKACVGMEINANHLRPVTAGWVTGTARPVSLGRRSQVWEVRIVDDNDKLVCISRCTMAVIEAS